MRKFSPVDDWRAIDAAVYAIEKKYCSIDSRGLGAILEEVATYNLGGGTYRDRVKQLLASDLRADFIGAVRRALRIR